jgi:nucleoid-associated protein YgaU
MTVRRDDMREIVYNSSESYADILARRGKNFIEQYATKQLSYPSKAQISSLYIKKHFWGVGDHYWKLASVHYGDPELWWVIAWFNKKPTEAHMRSGDMVYIPFPLDKLYNYLGV